MAKLSKPVEIEFLVTGDVTWASKSGRTERRSHVTAGTRMTVRIGHSGGDALEIWDGNWSILLYPHTFKVTK